MKDQILRSQIWANLEENQFRADPIHLFGK
jgi:hypothetical protein